MQKGISCTRKLLIYGNSCKVNALFNKGAHPRPSFFEESHVHLKISKPSGKPQQTTNKEVKAKTIKNHRGNQTTKKTKTFRPMSAKVDMGLKVFVCLFVCTVCFSRWLLIVFALASLVVLVSLVFPMVFDVLELSRCMFKRVPVNK